MYPTSEAYKTAIRQNVRDVCVSGTITLKDNSVINISDEDIVQGSLYFTEQCVSGENIEIGNVYASEMGLSLNSPPENPYSLDGARVVPIFGIDVGEGVYEYVPLGYFYVTEIERKNTAVALKALDGMILLDVDIAGVQTSGTPFGIVEACCAKAGITLATSQETFNTFANAGTTFVLPEESNISTCRDLLMWVFQLTGTFARMNRMGHLEVVPVTARASAREIVKADRFLSDVSDFFIKVAKVTMKVGETEYSQGTDGMTMALEENPFLIGREDAGINAALGNILNQVTMAEYTPCNVDFAGDPSLQAGDYVTLTDTGTIGGGDVVSIITHHTWRYRGKHNLKAAGKSDLIQGVQSQQSKAVATVVGIARAAQEIAKTANQSTQLINDAIGGHVLVRRAPGETNEILIMDSADPDQAVKIWRWNMGGLGYSDNCTGADNPARQYEVAMTMDGAINANFIKTGKIAAQYITVGSETVFADGYDPTVIQIGGRNLIIRHNEVPDTMIGEDGVSAPLVDSSMVNDFIPVQPGDTLTFSQIIQSGTGDDYFRCAFYTDPLDNASYVVRRISNNATVFTETVPEGAYWLRVSYATKNKVQLEKGNKATDWTPAPEDVEAYAEHKAAEAQAAAEAVARAEALAAQVNAEAYADGVVTAEEQARIDQAETNLIAAKSHAETKATEAEAAAKIYAEQKADDAQSAAEAYAAAQAEAERVAAEAYADGKVTAEEQARIDQATADLAAAKTHAETKAGEAQAAAKTYADAQLSDHDANQSPHSLPSYAKMESTGFKVYDDKGNLRTHNGQYAPGEYGNWVDAGHYILRDKGMDMSLEQLPNLIPDHSFECLERDSHISNYYDFEISGSCGYSHWSKVGSPKIDSARQTNGEFIDALHGMQCAVVNSSNYLTTYWWKTRATTYFVSGFACRGHRSPSAGTARIRVECYGDSYSGHELLQTFQQDFTLSSTMFDYKRVGFRFTVPANTMSIDISVLSTDSNWVYWDGIQLVEENKPIKYEPENSLWPHFWPETLPGHIVESGSNTNGHYIKFSNGKQVCWENHYIGNVEFIAQTANAVYGGHTGTLTFPASFIENPVAICNARSNGYLNSQVSSVTKSNLQIRIWSNYSTNMTGVTRDWVAVGRWK